MIPVIAIVGRPNVGKSTLFNQLTRSRDALVANQPGLTRDRQYGVGKVGEFPYIVVDTGGLSCEKEGIDPFMADQVGKAVEEADHLIFMVDGRAGLMGDDQEILKDLRKLNKKTTLAVNKTDGISPDVACADFFRLGIEDVMAIAASHGRGVHALIQGVYDQLESKPDENETSQELAGIRLAIVGRPNVGKSTLVNRMLGEDRVVAFDQPGTTRDSIFIPFERDGQEYTLIDTAGVRRRAKVKEAIEKFSAIKTLDAIERSHVVLLTLDARTGIVDQDATLLGMILESGRALVIAVNKWDGLQVGDKEKIKSELDRKFPFVDFARIHFISALHGSGVGNLFESVTTAYHSARKQHATPVITRLLERAIKNHQPPLVKGRRIKLRYAHQGGINPPIIVIHGNQTASVPDSYKRYLVNHFRKALKIQGTPVRIEFKGGENPYKPEQRKVKPTPRQAYREKLRQQQNRSGKRSR
jgi:GTPase